jgi:hypothetical protein
LVEIAAAVIGVVLTAVIGFKVASYRNLITYEITDIRHEVMVQNGCVVPFDTSSDVAPTRIFSFCVKIVNRGWKNLNDVKLHAEVEAEPFSVEKTASSISPATIALARRGECIELAIDFLPSKEEVTVSFSTLGRWCDLHRLTGAGASHKVESIHYYTGYQGALNFFKSLIAYLALGFLLAAFVASIINGAIENGRQPQARSENSKR